MKKIFVCGHRNPDLDSIAGAAALAELRRRQGRAGVCAICPGTVPERAKWLFGRFGLSLPESRHDVRVRVGDMIKPDALQVVQAGTALFDAVGELRRSSMARLPVVDDQGRYLGMLSPLVLLSELLNVSRGSSAGGSLTGRIVHTSVRLAARVLDAAVLTAGDRDHCTDYAVYVAAMSRDRFEAHLSGKSGALALIVGDRPEILLRALSLPIKLLIVTGGGAIDDLILSGAQERGVAVLRTALDSASAIRRLKFCAPVEFGALDRNVPSLSPGDLVREVRSEVLSASEDIFPVCDESGRLLGVLSKADFNAPPPFAMILVDHNESEQGLPGVEELPVIEVVDHHRIGMRPTAEPIKYTCDVVGSTCTLVAAMYRSSGESLDPSVAGVLLGGLVSDTLNLQSPTTADLDRRMAQWLEKLAGVSSDTLMREMMELNSALIDHSAEQIIESDRKNYRENGSSFAISQLEETHLELFHRRAEELRTALLAAVERDHLDFFILMVTDVVRGNSELLFVGSRAVERQLPYQRGAGGTWLLPGVLSRKKQLLPQIISIVSSTSGH